ncbi:unnamed protein product [Heterobilharzia americana]|nr:unnamed protein product [Heterobilharzia americana]
MNVSLAERLWKIIFIVFNSIFILFGFILFVIGIKAQTTFAKYNTIIQASTPAIFPTIIFTGIFSILTGCIGFVGVFKQKPIFFILHLVGLGVATIIDFAIATASAVVHDKFPIMAHDALRSAVRYYYYRHDIQTDFDKLQGNLKCCGATSFLDYTRMGANVPFSCRIGDLVYAEHWYLRCTSHPTGDSSTECNCTPVSNIFSQWNLNQVPIS